MEQSARTQAEESLLAKARPGCGQLQGVDPAALPDRVRQEATAAGAEVTVLDRRRTVLASFDAQGSSDGDLGKAVRASTPHSPEVRSILSQALRPGRSERDGVLYVAVPAGGPAWWFAWRIPWTDIRTVHVLRRGIVLASLLSLVVATLLAALLAQRVAKRLARIVVFANRIAAGDLTARVEEGNLDEISAVAHALDVTASRLEQSFHALRKQPQRADRAARQHAGGGHRHQPAGTGELVQCRDAADCAAARCRRAERWCIPFAIPRCSPRWPRRSDPAPGQPRRAISVSPGKIFEVNAAPMPGGGAVAVLHDVSENERSETTRRDFVANVSHELRTPLTCIYGICRDPARRPHISAARRASF